MADVIVSDEYINVFKALVTEEIAQFEKDYQWYVNQLKQLRVNGIMEGETANALDQFISNVSVLAGKLTDAAGGVETMSENYIQAENDADGDLYP